MVAESGLETLSLELIQSAVRIVIIVWLVMVAWLIVAAVKRGGR